MAEEQKQASTPGGVPRREGGHGGHGPGEAPVFPEEEGMQVLRREDGLHRLQARGHPVAVRAGARENFAAADDGSMCTASALAGRGHQARAQHRVAPVRRQCVRHASAARCCARSSSWCGARSTRPCSANAAAICTNTSASGRDAEVLRRSSRFSVLCVQ